MNADRQYTSLNASEARAHLYSLIKSAASGAKVHEIHLRGHKPVVLIGKDEIESWLETLDVMSNPEEATTIKTSLKSTKTYSLDSVIKELNLDES